MASIRVMKGPLDDERRGEALFGGDVLIFKDVAPLRRLSTLAGGLLRAVFGEAPAQAQFVLGPEEFAARASGLAERWRRHPAAVEGFREVLQDVGVELDRGYWDWLHLRIQTASGLHRDRDAGLPPRHVVVQHLRPNELVGTDTPDHPGTHDCAVPGLLVAPAQKHQRNVGSRAGAGDADRPDADGTGGHGLGATHRDRAR
jgi:hypothetical protein